MTLYHLVLICQFIKRHATAGRLANADVADM